MNALTPILERTRQDVAARRRDAPPEALLRAAEARLGADPPRGFADALRAAGMSVIAEHKRSSPSAGVIRDDLVLEDVVGAYERGGAAALSVLTEAHSFGGSLDDLAAARAAASLPILRKDFIVDPYQVVESAAARRRRHPADRRRPGLRASSRGFTPRRSPAAWTCSSRSTTRTELEVASGIGAAAHRHQQPGSDHPRRRHRADLRACGCDAGRHRGRVRVGLADARGA